MSTIRTPMNAEEKNAHDEACAEVSRQAHAFDRKMRVFRLAENLLPVLLRADGIPAVHDELGIEAVTKKALTLADALIKAEESYQ